MNARKLLWLTLSIGVVVTGVVALPVAAKNDGHHSQYAGQQSRAIKSLSADDVTALKAGAGWGLAKVAELNGVPGPRHLLEMKDEIDLSQAQVEAIEAIYQKMNASAVRLGEQLIEQEYALEQRFRNNIPDSEELEQLLSEIGKTRSALRWVHLSAHLDTPDILSPAQLTNYNRLRGYHSDPCESVPAGHDAKMWKKHNNCG